MENATHFIGADLSKKTIDLVCNTTKDHCQIQNSIEGYKEFMIWLKKQHISPSQIILVMEHTGLYSFCFEKFLHRKNILFSKVSALEIKKSIGLVRGKSDKVDARRIARFAYEKQNKLRIEKLTSNRLNSLKMLRTAREQLVKQRASLMKMIEEFKNIHIPDMDVIINAPTQVLNKLSQQISRIEKRIECIIAKDPELKKNYELLQSIKGVGPVVALATLIKTGNFSKFSSARKFACYCGTAPFEHSSGTSIRGRTRVSHLADKGMKSLLEMSARTAIQHNPEIKVFYQKRLAQGKSKSSTLNIIRNKIISRMFAVIRRQEPYIQDYLKAA